MVLILVFALTSLVSAASPTSDVPENHWAYQAIKKLAEAGIIEGYDSGRFNGDKVLTRYEFAVIVAKAIEKEEVATNEQKVIINKLADEYKTELDGLGVRVKVLEDKTSAVQVSGIGRARFDQQSDGSRYDDDHMNIDITVAYRINTEWSMIGESEWQRQFNMSCDYLSSGRNANNIPTVAATYNGTATQNEQLYMTGPLMGTIAKLGRQNYNPVYGLSFDTRIMGGTISFGNAVKTTLGHGKTDDNYSFDAINSSWAINNKTNIKASYQLLDNHAVKIKYSSIGFDSKIFNDITLTSAVAKSDNVTNNKAYLDSLQFMNANYHKVNSKDYFVSYKKIPANAVYSSSDTDTEDRILDINFKGTQVGFDYVPMENSKFTFWYMHGKNATDNTTYIKVYRGQIQFYF